MLFLSYQERKTSYLKLALPLHRIMQPAANNNQVPSNNDTTGSNYDNNGHNNYIHKDNK